MMKETKQDEGEGSGSCLPDFRVDRLQDFSFERNKNKNKKRNARLFSAKPKMKKKKEYLNLKRIICTKVSDNTNS
jgi:hypothetical protein